MSWAGPVIGFREYSDIEIQQMMGRAGRPQYDKSGVVIVSWRRLILDSTVWLTLLVDV